MNPDFDERIRRLSSQQALDLIDFLDDLLRAIIDIHHDVVVEAALREAQAERDEPPEPSLSLDELPLDE